MKRKFVTNLALLLFLNLLVKPFWIFGVDRSVQNTVGESEYGLYFSLFQLTVLLNVILDLGLQNFNKRDIAQHNQLLSKYLSNIFGLKIILAVVYFIICFSIGFIIGYDERQFKLLAILALNQFIAVFILYLRSNISALLYFKTDSFISVLDRVLMIILCSFILWGKKTGSYFSIEIFAYIQTIAYLLTFVIAFLFVLSKSEFFKIRIEKSYIIALLKKSYPFAILILLMGIYTYIDAVLLERMLPDGKFQAGVYAQSFRIYNAFYMFGFLYAGLLLPIFAKMIKDKEPVGQLVQFSFLLLIVPTILLIISCVFYRTEIIGLLYPDYSRQSPLIFALLSTGFLGTCFTIIFGTLLTANGSLKELNLMAMAGITINIILNIILIPKLKATGAAYAALITQITTGLIQLIIAIKVFKFHINYKLIIVYGIFFGGIIGLGFLIKQLHIFWVYDFFATIIIGLIFAVSIKLINFKVIYQIIKYGDN